MTGPLVAVLDAVRGGVHTVPDIERHTGLGRGTVSASLDHLVRMGHLRADELPVGCPPGGCAACVSTGCGSAGESGIDLGPAPRARILTLTPLAHSIGIG